MLCTGYESWRSPIEARPLSEEALGNAVEPGVLVPVKGFGRASVIFFAICYSYLNLKEMEGEVQADFQRRGFAKTAVGSIGSPLKL